MAFIERANTYLYIDIHSRMVVVHIERSNLIQIFWYGEENFVQEIVPRTSQYIRGPQQVVFRPTSFRRYCLG